MQQVQTVSCTNSAAFVMSFHMVYEVDGKRHDYGNSGSYAVGKVRTIDMAAAPNIKPGAKMWPRVHATAGKTQDGPPVEYQHNANNATYTVTGTTLSFHVKLNE